MSLARLELDVCLGYLPVNRALDPNAFVPPTRVLPSGAVQTYKMNLFPDDKKIFNIFITNHMKAYADLEEPKDLKLRALFIKGNLPELVAEVEKMRP